MSKVIIPLLVYVAIMAITPGPNNLTCLFLGARYGKGGAKRFIFGSMVTLFAKGMMGALLAATLLDGGNRLSGMICKKIINRYIRSVNNVRQIGAVMTNRYFTKGAKELANATKILLWDRNKLIQMMQ